MSIELVTGHAGSAHVTSAQDGRLNAAAWGDGKYVLPMQSQFAITVDSPRTARITMLQKPSLLNRLPSQGSQASRITGPRRPRMVTM